MNLKHYLFKHYHILIFLANLGEKGVELGEGESVKTVS